MKRYEEFHPSGYSYAGLQHRVEGAIELLLEDAAQRPTSPLEDQSFHRKLDLLGDLLEACEGRVRFNAGDLHASELRKELIQLLKKASELYERSGNPSLLGVHLRDGSELPARIMDVADYVTYADCMLDEFLLESDSVM